MELKNQVCSLELAKKLKELGVKQESLFKWTDEQDKESYLVYSQNKNFSYHYSAFTVAELGEMLPKEIKADKEYFIKQSFTILGLSIIKYTDTDGYDFISWSSITEADARAKTLIYLLENKLIEIK